MSKCEHQLLYYFRKNFPAHQLAIVISSVIQKYQLIEFMPLVESIRTGDLRTFNDGLVKYQDLFIRYVCFVCCFSACVTILRHAHSCQQHPCRFQVGEFTSFSKSVRPYATAIFSSVCIQYLGNPISHYRTLRKRSNGWECRWIWTRLNAF